MFEVWKASKNVFLKKGLDLLEARAPNEKFDIRIILKFWSAVKHKNERVVTNIPNIWDSKGL